MSVSAAAMRAVAAINMLPVRASDEGWAHAIDDAMGPPELLELVRRAEAHLAAECWLEETPGEGYLLRDIRAAIAKAEGR